MNKRMEFDYPLLTDWKRMEIHKDYNDSDFIETSTLYSLIVQESSNIEMFHCDLFYDISYLTTSEPGSVFAWMPRKMGTQLYILGEEGDNERVSSALHTWENDIRVYIIEKHGNGVWKMYRLIHKEESEDDVMARDKQEKIQAALQIVSRKLRTTKEVKDTNEIMDLKKFILKLLVNDVLGKQ